MRQGSRDGFGWRGASLVAITYVYFLIFAQFAFLKRLAELGDADARLKLIMAAMAAGGILFSLLVPRLKLWPNAGLRLRLGLGTSAVAAFLTLLPLSCAAALATAFLVGAGLGLLTVTLVTHLRQWTGDSNPLLAVGAGTGIGYFVCNFPPLFTASPEAQAATAGILCLVGAGLTLMPTLAPLEPCNPAPPRTVPFLLVLSSFTALVWLDSAAFFIIQNTPALKAGTWQGSLHLWADGSLHLLAALAAAVFLLRRGLFPVLAAAFVALGGACLLLHNPASVPFASILYPVGVSLYSVALVAYPSLLASASFAPKRGKIAGWLYAVAGWTGSAMGIGMAQHLGYVPVSFILAAGAVVLLPAIALLMRRHPRELALTALVLLVAAGTYRIESASRPSPELNAVERGRQVYVSEGCIDCHSQYVRPNTPDVLMWGPVEPISLLRSEHPPLIGNRRQGPDLSQVGTRRSPLWLKAHFFNPAEVSGASIMPSYSFLFRDQRGNDLIAYLESLRGAGAAQHLAAERSWRPAPEAIARATAAAGARLYRQDCATCHDSNGHTRRIWSASFRQIPTNLATGPFHYLPASGTPRDRAIRLAQIVKFGIPGTDMAGHEYLSDKDVASIALWLSQTSSLPIRNEKTRLHSGE
jgi:cbb3-type cytochrome c oxidase subunit II